MPNGKSIFYNSQMYYKINDRIALYSDITNAESKIARTFRIEGIISANGDATIESQPLVTIPQYTYMVLFVYSQDNYTLNTKISFDADVASTVGVDISNTISLLSWNLIGQSIGGRNIFTPNTLQLYYYAYNQSSSANSKTYTICGYYFT